MRDDARLGKTTPLAEERPYEPPPQNLAAEQALLGCVLGNNATLERVSDFLRPEHFVEPVHGRIFASVLATVAAGRVANPVTLKAQFDQDPALAERGGAKYLVDLLTSVVTTINAADYGRTVHDLYLRRQLVEIAGDLARDARLVDPDASAADVMRVAEERIYALATDRLLGRAVRGSLDTIDAAIAMTAEAYKNQGRLVGTPTGIAKLDRLTGGMQAAHLIVVAGRPSMGKSLLADSMAVAAARSFESESALTGKPARRVLCFDLEMTAEQVGQRRLSANTWIDLERIARGTVTQEEFDRLLGARGRIGSWPILEDDTTGLAVADMRARARRVARLPGGLGFIKVDYLQLIRPPHGTDPSPVTRITDVTQGLKAMAKEFGVPVVAVSQLSRKVEERDDKRPMLSDLRESGSIEQDADVVMFVFREYYYLSRAEPARRPGEKDEAFADRRADHFARLDQTRDKADVYVAKQRQGAVGHAPCFFDGARATFGDRDEGSMELPL